MKIRVLLMASALLAGPAFAQDSAPSAELQDIVVTANKRSESAQSVAASISVITGESLAASGVTAPDKLVLVTPGMVFDSSNGFAQPFIRGIGSDQVSPVAETPVSIYLDGVYISSPSAGLQAFGDIERVEVLKGPQGTLYGRNSTGGAINIITRTPEVGFSGNVALTAGTWDTRRAVAYFGGGNDIVRASFSGVYVHHKGFMRNLFNGVGLNNEDAGGVRAKVVVTPNDIITATFAADYYRADDYNGSGYTSVYGTPLAANPLIGGRFSTDPRQTYHDTNFKHQERHWGVSANLRAALDGLDLVSITAYRKYDRYSFSDLDASDAPILAVSGPQPLRTFSQELQVVSNNDSKFEWIVGAYYFYSNGGFKELHLDQPGAPFATPPGARFTDIIGFQRTRAYAAFGQGTLSFTDNLSLTLGGRYNKETKTLTRSEVRVPAFGVIAYFPLSSLKTNNFSPMASLKYKTDNMLLYATASKGFKSGGYSLASPGEAAVQPEKITAYEIGGKHTLLDRRLRFN